MSDRELNHELNDELLSAYLDGELTDAERATVEARLASDQDAKHTLQQLRMVSQSVQALPQVPIGRDLREMVLRQAEQMKPAARVATAAESTPSRLGDTMPQITIFRTRRSWVWASLVVAAGLLIMFLQSGDERSTNVAAVKHDNGGISTAPVDAPAQRSLGERSPSRAIDSEKIAKTESPAPMAAEPPGGVGLLGPGMQTPPPAPSNAAPQAPAEAAPPTSIAADRRGFKSLPPSAGPNGSSTVDKFQEEAVDDTHESAPIAAASPATASRTDLGADSESKVALDAGKVAAGKSPAPSSPQAMGRASAVGGGLRPAASSPDERLDESNQLVVVHVVAKPDAFKNKTFDQLLVHNGMQSRSETGERSGITDGRLSKLAEKEQEAQQLAGAQTAAEQNVDLVFVDAPQSAIVSCLASLKRDTENYVGIEVDQPPTDKDRADPKLMPNKKAADDLSAYSRGSVPERQKDLLRNERYFYENANTYGVRSGTPSTFGGGVGGANDNVAQKVGHDLLTRQQADLANRGRARRFSYSEEQNRRGGEAKADSEAAGPSAASAPAKQAPLPQDRKAKAEEATENMHVLFFVSRDSEAASSAPADKAAK